MKTIVVIILWIVIRMPYLIPLIFLPVSYVFGIAFAAILYKRTRDNPRWVPKTPPTSSADFNFNPSGDSNAAVF
jgi:hypothetical protein